MATLFYFRGYGQLTALLEDYKRALTVFGISAEPACSCATDCKCDLKCASDLYSDITNAMDEYIEEYSAFLRIQKFHERHSKTIKQVLVDVDESMSNIREWGKKAIA